MPALRIEAFAREDQAAARALVLQGLGEHWGQIDERLNPDLDDISASYADGCFVVARCGDALIGTGGFRPHDASSVQIHRVSVAAARRGEGIGEAIVRRLLDEARRLGFERAVLETTASWRGVVAFWKTLGFVPTHVVGGDQYFELRL